MAFHFCDISHPNIIDLRKCVNNFAMLFVQIAPKISIFPNFFVQVSRVHPSILAIGLFVQRLIDVQKFCTQDLQKVYQELDKKIQ